MENTRKSMMSRGLASRSSRIVVIAGGRGTRSKNPSVPKLLVEFAPGQSPLNLILSCASQSSVKSITFVLGHLADPIIRKLQESQGKYPDLSISWIVEEKPNGTAGALALATENYPAEKYMVVLGDIVVNAPIDKLMNAWERSGTESATVVHPNLHPWDSDQVITDSNGFALKFRTRKQTSDAADGLRPIRSMCGVYFFQHQILAKVSHVTGDISEDLMKAILSITPVRVINSSFFFQDSGTPERIERLSYLSATGAIQRRGKNLRAAIFLDRDGTLIPDIGTQRSSLGSAEFHPQIASAIALANDAGIPVFVITNQPGIAKGQIVEDDVLLVQGQLENLLAGYQAFIDDFRFCPHHPDSGFIEEIKELKVKCGCRKPEPGMVFSIAEEHEIEITTSWLIGDSERDFLLASKLGMNFCRVRTDSHQSNLPELMPAIVQYMKHDYF
jgi:mannose-1-phosphate guanylyltransferase/phosphomannomutase